jgi:hypothetical protein
MLSSTFDAVQVCYYSYYSAMHGHNAVVRSTMYASNPHHIYGVLGSARNGFTACKNESVTGQQWC